MSARHPQLEAFAAALTGGVAPHLPRTLALALGRILGRVWGRLDRRHASEAAVRLQQAFPEWPVEQVTRSVAAVYAHFGSMLFDILWLRGKSREQVLSLVDFEGVAHVESALARGRGVLLLTGHIGNWELHGVAHGLRFGPIGVLARQQQNPALDARLNAIRSLGGNKVIYKRKALAQAISGLRGGGGIAILIDQNMPPGDGVFVDFFGRPAATTTIAAALALKTGCALVPCRTELRPDGRYTLRYDPPVRVNALAERRAETLRITQQLTGSIEAWVRATPEQWLWLHRRWKTQPPAGGAA